VVLDGVRWKGRSGAPRGRGSEKVQPKGCIPGVTDGLVATRMEEGNVRNTPLAPSAATNGGGVSVGRVIRSSTSSHVPL